MSCAAAEAEGFIVEDGEEIGVDFLHELLTVRDFAAPLHGLTTPVLFVHGEADSEVPFVQSARAAELVAGPHRLVPVSGGDHCLRASHERDIVYGETTAWLRAYL